MSGKERIKSKNIKKKNNIEPKKDELLIQKNSIETFFKRRSFLFFYLSLVLCLLFGILLFDVKVSTGEDDSGYIIQAAHFLKGKSFPTWHGSFYPVFLSLPMAVFGFNILIFKIFSLLFIAGHLIFIYFAFKNEVTPPVLLITLLLIAFNSSILYFGSQTYSEALYMFLQALTFFIVYKLILYLGENDHHRKFNLKLYLPLGFLVFLMSITRNIGVTVLLTVIVFFLFDKKIFPALYSIVAFLIFKVPFELYKRIVWNLSSDNTQGQLSEILYKNPYNKTLGKEDFAGMVTRYFENLKIYISKHFFNTIGLRNPDSIDVSYFPAIIVIIIFCLGLYYAFKKIKQCSFLVFI